MDPGLEQLERYRVLEEVGRGGMAVVYRGRDRTLDREVAIKVLHAHLADAPESRARFQQEARAVAKLRHPNIIEIFDYDAGDDGAGPSYIVTEFIEGRTLKDFIEQEQTFFPEVAALIAVEICEAIGHAHGLGIIHRDLKPENMMITTDGRLKLMDFGIAKVIDQQQQMTMTGSILGSPAHMAPEMLEGRDLDIRSDLFSLGTILYWLATGNLPFMGKNPHQTLRRILEGDYLDPQQVNPELGTRLCRIIKRCLAMEPAERYANAGELKQALLETMDDLELDEPAAELTRFFTGPKAYIDALRPRVTERLLARGQTLLKAKQHRPALEALDRLLAMEPGHPEALSLVNSFERRKQLMRRLSWLGAAAALVLLAAFGAWAALTYWPPDDPSSADAGPADTLDAGLAAVVGPKAEEPGPEPAQGPDAGAVDKTVDAGTVAAAADPAPAAKPDAGVARTRPDRKRVVAVRKPIDRKPDPPKEHEIQIVCEPFFERIKVGDKIVAKNDSSTSYGQVYKGSLPVGKHRVAIERGDCQTLEFDANVPEEPKTPDELIFRKKLRFKPAGLVVDTPVADASVFVDGEYKGTAGQSKTKPIVLPIEGKTGSVEIALRLTHPKAGEARSKVSVMAAKRTTIKVPAEAFTSKKKTPEGG